MKNNLLSGLWLFAAATALCSCANEAVEELPKNDPTQRTITASIEQQESRIELGGDKNLNLHWEAGDKISMATGYHNGTSHVEKTEYELISGAGTTSGVFNYKMLAETTTDIATSKGYAAAVYPSDCQYKTINGEISEIRITDQQLYKQNNIGLKANIMVANGTILSSSKGSLSGFRSVCGAIKFRLPADILAGTVDRININTGSDQVPIVGQLRVNKDLTTVEMKPSESSSQYLSLMMINKLYSELQKEDIYIVLPPQTYPAGFAITVWLTSGSRLSMGTTQRAFTVERGVICNLGDVFTEELNVTVKEEGAPESEPGKPVTAPILLVGGGAQVFTLRVNDNTKTEITHNPTANTTMDIERSTINRTLITVTLKAKDWTFNPENTDYDFLSIKQGKLTKRIPLQYKPHIIGRFTAGNLVQDGGMWKAKVGQPLERGFICLYGSGNGYFSDDRIIDFLPRAYATFGDPNGVKLTNALNIALPEGRRTSPRGWDAASLITKGNEYFLDICDNALKGGDAVSKYRTPTAKEFAELIWGPKVTPDTNQGTIGLKEIKNGTTLLGWAAGPNRERVTFRGGALLNADPIVDGAMFFPATGQMQRTNAIMNFGGMGAYMTSSSAATGSDIYRLYLSESKSGVFHEGSDWLGVLRCIRK